MHNGNQSHIHLHVHEGASVDAVRAGAEALRGSGGTATDHDEASAASEPDADARAGYVRRAYTESEGKAKPLLEFLGDNPERWIPFPEAREHLGYDNPRSFSGLLGSFGRRAIHRYEGIWPFHIERRDGEWQLFMSKENASVINAVR
jgi:hypothetical protein